MRLLALAYCGWGQWGQAWPSVAKLAKRGQACEGRSISIANKLEKPFTCHRTSARATTLAPGRTQASVRARLDGRLAELLTERIAEVMRGVCRYEQNLRAHNPSSSHPVHRRPRRLWGPDATVAGCPNGFAGFRELDGQAATRRGLADPSLPCERNVRSLYETHATGVNTTHDACLRQRSI